MEKEFQSRIKYSGDIKPFLENVCADYGIGNYISHKAILSGYEDFNLIIETENGKYFAKVYANFRSNNDCLNLTNTLVKIIESGISHPKLIKSPNGYLYVKQFDNHEFRLVLMEYIDGINFLEGNLIPSEEEKRFLINQAALINSVDLKPDFVYDSWAIVNFLKEFEKSKNCLGDEALRKIELLANEFESLDIAKLPHCFVHGDIIKTNALKDKNGKLYIIDFSVSNYYPRIVELAVLLCNMLFDENNPSGQENYQLALDEYQKKIELADIELKILPLFTKIAHAMHVIRGTYEREINNNQSEENTYWINLGKTGLGLGKD